MSSIYRDKLISLVDKLFIDVGDSKTRIKNCEKKIQDVKIYSYSDDVPIDVQKKWEDIWNDLHSKEPFKMDGDIVITSIETTLRNKRCKSMEKYLLFILEEFYRVL